MLSRLKARDVPEVTIEKLKAIVGVRFPNEKKFNKTVEGLLTKGEIKKYSQEISIEAWSFRPGSRMNLTFLDINNNQVEARFRIAGIYDLKNTMFEMSNVFVRDSVLKRLAGFDDKIFHQVVVRIDNIDSTEVITGNLRSNLPGMEIVNWKELQPDLAMMTDYVHQIYGIFMAIIMAALAFGIVNTMLMAVLERTKELGMLAAIGMNRRRVFSMIMLESVFLSITGGIGGMIVGWAVILLTARNGINFLQYAEGMEALGYSAHVFPQISAAFFIMMAVMVVLTGILSSVYPAMKALKLNPVEAIRTE
jgi:ABC-type lipoprotein release transport system permease subunit